MASCPRCGFRYSDPPALSRWDNETEVCPICGSHEAIIQFALGAQCPWEQRDQIVHEAVHPIRGIQRWSRVPSKARRG